MKCHGIARFLSIQLIPLLLSVYLVYVLVTISDIRDEDAKLVSEKFDKAKKPVWFGHITDLHVTEFDDKARINLKAAFEALNVINPTQILVTGDVVNAYKEDYNHCSTTQDPEQYKLFREIRDETVANKSKLFVTLGNHDAFGTVSWDRHPGLDIFTLDPSKYAGTVVEDGVRLVMYNPIITPVTTSDTMTYWLSPFPETLEALEDELEKETDAKQTFVMTHQVTEMFLPADMRSRKTNRTLLEILNEPKYNIVALINGHTHPEKTQFRRYKNFIECTQVSLSEQRYLGIPTLDNGRFSYSSIPINEKNEYSFVTYPIPENIAVHAYPKDDFQVRLVSISNEDKNFVVSGDVNGVMKKDIQLAENAWLYTLDADISNGHHSIKITGDADIAMNFTVGEDIEGKWHYRYLQFNWEMFDIMTIITLVLMLIETIPAFLPDKLFKGIDEVNKWLSTGEGESHYIKAILLGPIITGRRFSQHKFIAATIIVSLISAFTAPMLFYEVDGVPCRLHYEGIMFDKTFRYDIMARYYVTDAFVFFYIPTVAIASLTYFGFKFSNIPIALFNAAFIAQGFYDTWRYLYKVDPDNWLKSPLFFGFPILIGIESFIALFISPKKQQHIKKE